MPLATAATLGILSGYFFDKRAPKGYPVTALWK